ADLAHLLNCKPSSLAHLLYKVPPASKYYTFELPKRGGGVRKISAPIPRLKLLQARLANLLQECWAEICTQNKWSDSVSHGFKKGRSVFSNAKKHRNHNLVFNTDIANFFPSINFGRVR